VIGQTDERFDDHAPAGEVVEQVPAPGEELLQGDTVELTVSKGIEQVEVPDLAGKTRDEAEAALDDAQLGADFVDEYSDEVPTPGRVSEQSVAAGSEVDKGSTVVVTISRGPLTFPIPRVEGKPVDEAEAELRDLDLDVRVIKEPRPRVGPFRRGEFGLVEAQNPQPGEPVQLPVGPRPAVQGQRGVVREPPDRGPEAGVQEGAVCVHGCSRVPLRIVRGDRQLRGGRDSQGWSRSTRQRSPSRS
jgi:beta-lactam-binding protein with PASTA domain